MPTNKPKISIYCHKEVYDRFVQFQRRHNLSASEAGTIIIAEYFGLEKTIIGSSGKIITGGITLKKIQNIEARLKKLEDLVPF